MEWQREVTFHLQIVSCILSINSAVSKIPGRGLLQKVDKIIPTVCNSGLGGEKIGSRLIMVTHLQWQVLLYEWILTGADLYLGLLSKSKNATASALSPSSVGWLPSNHLWDNVRLDSHIFRQRLRLRLRLDSDMQCLTQIFWNVLCFLSLPWSHGTASVIKLF